MNKQRLLWGPWQSLERDTARLLLANGFEHVRVVGGTGDKGGDVLAVKDKKLWVVQCKFTTASSAPKDAISEVVEAARFYKADKMLVVVSRAAAEGFHAERDRFSRLGLKVPYAEPSALLRWMESTPEYPKSRKALRPYQEEVSDKFREALLDTGRAQIVLATGLGKTVIMAETVSDLFRDNLIEGGRVLVLAHTRELVNQLHSNFWHQLPKWISTHQLSEGEKPSYWDGITFATIQSATSKLHELPNFGLVLIDEAHHVGADIFQKTVKALSPKMLGGVTATPWRGDGYDIDEILGAPLVKIGISDGLRQGFLSEIDYRLFADNVDWDFIQEASKFKYSLSQLNRKLIIPTRDEEACIVIKKIWDVEHRKSGIIYSPTIMHANVFCAMLRQFGFKAEAISSALESRARDSLMSRFRAGDLDLVATVDLFNEGVDVPDVDLIVFMRTTHSRRIFVQQLGRGLRTSATKDKVVVLDFVTDLRRIAEVVELDRAAKGGTVEHLGLGGRLVQFSDKSAGSFLKEWMLDQASLVLREEDPRLEVPHLDFPETIAPGGVE